MYHMYSVIIFVKRRKRKTFKSEKKLLVIAKKYPCGARCLRVKQMARTILTAPWLQAIIITTYCSFFSSMLPSSPPDTITYYVGAPSANTIKM